MLVEADSIRVRYRFAHLEGRVPGGPSLAASAADSSAETGAAGGVRRRIGANRRVFGRHWGVAKR